MGNDSIKKTLIVAVSLCIVCSVLVSGAAVLLRPIQEQEKALDIKKNILSAAGLIENTDLSKEEVLEKFKAVTPVLVDLETFQTVKDEDEIENYDQYALANDPSEGEMIPGDQDLGQIKFRAKKAKVFFVKDSSGELKKVILPIHGKGLWSTLYGFLALENDFNTVAGITFYSHGETAGLGAEIENPRWRALWVGKKVSDSGDVKIEVIKGNVDPNSSKASHQVDGISGATITGRGVMNLVRYWVGEYGLGPFLNKLKENAESI